MTSDALDDDNSFEVQMLANQVIKNATLLGQSPTFDWLEKQLARGRAALPSLTDDDLSTVRHLVNDEITVVAEKPPAVLQTREGRSNLISEDDLSSCDFFWERFQNRLRIKTSKGVAKSLDDTTNRILKLMPRPKQAEEFCCKGLVIGDVQAGKTNNYTGIINKAADLGYKLIIVLTGVTEGLRNQTQGRLDADFVGMQSVAERSRHMHQPVGVGIGSGRLTDRSRTPATLTDQTFDFRRANATGIRVDGLKNPALIVTKKNKSILENINNWIQSQVSEDNGKINEPVLIIDDEADNASVNTGTEDEDPKAINFAIRTMLSKCSRVTYLAYTATPFANIFIDPESQMDSSELIDLYPSHFIVALDTPSNYCGGGFFYNPEHAKESEYVIREITDCEPYIPIKHKTDLRPPAIPPSMKEAIRSFYVATAVKDLRRDRGRLDPEKNKFDSCLINVSRFTQVQNDLKEPVSEFIESVNDALASGLKNHSEIEAIKSVYELHYQGSAEISETWDSILAQLRVMEQPVLKVVHSRTKDDLDYSTSSAPAKVIAIGGFKLSRGLTLEGLTVSYFYRQSMMYDTLMQMARWFGYRDGYRDLIRLYTAPSAVSWYRHITDATQELKDYLVNMENAGREPSEFGIRVRSHEDALIVTAKNKMRLGLEVQTSTSFQNKIKESVFVDRRETPNRQNIDAVDRFFKNNASQVRAYEADGKGNNPRFWLIESVDANSAINLLESLKIDWGNDWARTGVLLNYFKNHSTGLFKKWDLAFQSKRDASESLSIGKNLEVGVQIRRPKKLSTPIGAGLIWEDRIKHSLSLSDNRRVASGDIDYVGIPEGILEVKPELKNSATKARDWKRTNRCQPALIFHLIHFDIDKAIEGAKAEDKDRLRAFKQSTPLFNPYLAFTISIPGCNDEAEAYSYIINKNEFEEMFGVYEDEE